MKLNQIANILFRKIAIDRLHITISNSVFIQLKKQAKKKTKTK